jgi:hypothetical protein
MSHRHPHSRPTARLARLAGAALGALALAAQADVITDWNLRSSQIIGEARIGTPPAIRVMAIVQTAAYEAVRDASRMPTASSQAVELAVAAAHRGTLAQLLPAQRAAIDAAFNAATAAIGDDAARARHLAIGERAAQRVLAERANDLPRTAESYRPHTTAGAYVPTVTPAVVTWSQRKPWLLERADQFRPGPPPALTSERWARDFNEVKLMGRRDSPQRSPEQTAIARFWDYSLPAVYHGVVQSVALQPGRDALANARLFAAVAQAMDDAMIAVFDAKYTYNFWRPGTAIRNGDIDGHDATERDAQWVPLIDVPLHPEYPSAHSILAAAVGSLLEAEVAGAPMPPLATSSPTAGGATRRWNQVDHFVQEVGEARVLEGVHFRNSVEVGEAMGRRIGALAAARWLAPTRLARQGQ